MNQKEKQKRESREKILMAASQLFREKGFHATGVDELMAKAGLTAGAFYAHFKSKKDLLKHSLKYCLDKNRRILFAGLEGVQGRQLAEAVLSRYVSVVHRDHPELGCPLPSMAAELHRHPKETGPLISQYLETYIASIMSQFEGTQAQKREQAVRLISQAVGAVLLSRMTSKELSKEFLVAGQKVSS